MELNSRYLDAHVYVIKRSALNILNEKPHLSSIKGELIPYLLKLQFKRFKTNVNDRISSNQDSPSSLNSTERPSQSSALLKTLADEDSIGKALQRLSATSIELDRNMNLVQSYPHSPVRCHAYVLDASQTLSRANHLLAYVELNRMSRSLLETLCEPIESKPLDSKATVSEDSLVDSRGSLSDRCTVRSCIVAAGCNVSDKSRLTNCVLMRDVQIAEGCVLVNCILCPGAVLSERCELKDCIVGANQSLKESSKFPLINIDFLKLNQK
jgi:translation initiation factor eIF-2B subunit gamma